VQISAGIGMSIKKDYAFRMPHLKWVAAVVSTLLIPALCQETVKYPDDYCEHIKEGEEFDFIVVGAGK